MANKVLIKRSSVPAKVPTTSDLDLGELGINTYDGKLYLKKDDGTPAIVQIGGGGVSLDVENTFTKSQTISTSGEASLFWFNGPSGYQKGFRFQTGGLTRWSFQSTGTAESGSNAGSDFTVNRFDDAGAYLGAAFQINRATGQTTLEGLSVPTVDLGNGDTTLSRSAAGVLAVEGIDVLLTGKSANITKGYTVTPYNNGSKTSGTFTPDPANGNYQYYTNGGAHTIAAPASDCAIDMLVINGASGAGAITMSGFKTPGSNVAGATYATTANRWWILSIRRINGVSTYTWQGPWS